MCSETGSDFVLRSERKDSTNWTGTILQTAALLCCSYENIYYYFIWLLLTSTQEIKHVAVTQTSLLQFHFIKRWVLFSEKRVQFVLRHHQCSSLPVQIITQAEASSGVDCILSNIMSSLSVSVLSLCVFQGLISVQNHTRKKRGSKWAARIENHLHSNI